MLVLVLLLLATFVESSPTNVDDVECPLGTLNATWCINGGKEVSPNTCECAPLWGGMRCQIPYRLEDIGGLEFVWWCLHGKPVRKTGNRDDRGTPSQCNCDPGWTGSYCDTPCVGTIIANGSGSQVQVSIDSTGEPIISSSTAGENTADTGTVPPNNTNASILSVDTQISSTSPVGPPTSLSWASMTFIIVGSWVCGVTLGAIVCRTRRKLSKCITSNKSRTIQPPAVEVEVV